MSWCFAIINGKLAEIYFEPRKKKEPKVFGHCYVRKEDYKTKKEQKYIREDTAKYQFSYRNKIYKDINTGRLLQ